ncbi:endonuclease/exonuclease/phosphatase family protein [Kutzneria chonburiensis]|uniref:Endonuclease/exonuclease/phosphatase family protein n=1 Tax=Kutzneria chonburiensis TaxID=1483604 RepID=A0ABV6MKK3_9PSEU|nr:endonuclease/exonuclease/phosphatase family protein [Kutzneria chonburiensis]
MLLKAVSYNALNLFESSEPGELARYERVAQVLRDVDADIVAVQEIIAIDGSTAGARLEQFGEMIGRACLHAPHAPAVAVGNQRFHVGLLWRADRVEVVPGSFWASGRTDFWHALARLTVVVDGARFRVASHHATPFGRHMRADQMERVVASLTRPHDRAPGAVAADWNCVSADRVPDDQGRLGYYDPDPYAGLTWHDDMVYQCRWESSETGQRRHWADREPGEVLAAGGLVDAAAALKAAWEPTVGHWATDPSGPRRIDAWKCTNDFVAALRDVEVVRTDLARLASDHLPVVMTVETDDLRR